MPKGDAPPAKRAKGPAKKAESEGDWSSESDDERPIAAAVKDKDKDKESGRKGKVRISIDPVVVCCVGLVCVQTLTRLERVCERGGFRNVLHTTGKGKTLTFMCATDGCRGRPQ
jgi:hypothetical protein